MKRIYWIALLCTLLGVAGYWWFEHWYGWITAAGVAALRIGPLFAWRVILRFIRKRIILALFDQSPSWIKRPVRQFGMYLRRRFYGVVKRIADAWGYSWIVRAVIIVPIVVTLAVRAYGSEGYEQFVFLFFIPFLTAGLFPTGFWILVFGYIAQVMAAYGLEFVLIRIAQLIPEDAVDGIREASRKWNTMLAKKGRPVRARLTRWKRLASGKKIESV